jgi:hypothetical protein
MSDSEDESSGEESPVTSEWLEAILASYHQQELHHSRDRGGGGGDAEEDGVELSINIGDFSVGPGCDAGECVLSDILAVKVQYRVSPGTPDPRTLNLIVKLLPHDPFSRFFVTEAQFDLREIKFYTQVSSPLVLESYSEDDGYSGLREIKFYTQVSSPQVLESYSEGGGYSGLTIPLCFYLTFTFWVPQISNI